MDMQKLLFTKRIVASLFDGRQRQVVRIALKRRIATLERMAGNLHKENVASPDLIEQLCVIRGVETPAEEEAFPHLADMGVLAAFMEISTEQLKLEAERQQGTLFDSGEGEVSAAQNGAARRSAEAERLPDDEADRVDPTDPEDEWVPWSCSVCGEVRNYPRRDLPDNSATLCPKDCGPTMRPVTAEGAPDADDELEASETPEGEPGADELVDADYEIVDYDAIREQRLEERPEFRGRRAINALQEAQIYTVGDLLRRASSPIPINRIKRLGKTSGAQVEAVLDGIKRELAERTNGTAPVAGDEETADVAVEGNDGLPF